MKNVMAVAALLFASSSVLAEPEAYVPEWSFISFDPTILTVSGMDEDLTGMGFGVHGGKIIEAGKLRLKGGYTQVTAENSGSDPSIELEYSNIYVGADYTVFREKNYSLFVSGSFNMWNIDTEISTADQRVFNGSTFVTVDGVSASGSDSGSDIGYGFGLNVLETKSGSMTISYNILPVEDVDLNTIIFSAVAIF